MPNVSKLLFSSVILILMLTNCKTDSVKQDVIVVVPKVTSTEFNGALLFVTGKDFQIKTSETAKFSSTDPFIQISPSGVINRIVSGEVAAINITWPEHPTIKTRIFALGATDDTVDPPFSKFQGRQATDAYGSYKQGWETLKSFPKSDASYAIVLRHADADNGKDYNLLKKGEGPNNWWKSCDSTLARQLSPVGRQRAMTLGVVFKDLSYPISRVVSSEFCRAQATAKLMNLGLPIVTEKSINHPDYNVSGKSLFNGLISILDKQPTDHKITLISTHHPINEIGYLGYLSFPNISPFNWTGAYIVKIDDNKVITYEGAVSYGMFKLWRDLKTK